MKTNLMRRALAFTLAAAMTVGFTGCGKEEQSEAQMEGSQVQTEESGKHKKADERIENAKAANQYLKRYLTIRTPDGTIYSMGNIKDGRTDYIRDYLDPEGNFYVRGNLRQEDVTDYAFTNQDICMIVGDRLLGKGDFPFHDYMQDEDSWEMTDFTDQMLRNTEEASTIPTEIFSEYNHLWGLDEDGYPYMDREAFHYFDEDYDGEPDIECVSWTDLAVFDIAFGSDDIIPELKDITIAGIQKDGTVLAEGPMAEEILSWGPLAHISMTKDMAVGLTMDGKIKAAGNMADVLLNLTDSMTDVVGVSLIDDKMNIEVKAVDKEGNIYWFNDYRVGCKIMPDKIEIIEPVANVGSEFKHIKKITPDGKYMYINPDTLEWTE